MTWMVGGVMAGYCATGRVKTEMTPASVMTMDSTAAKIGRSMKNRENTEFPILAGTTSFGWPGQNNVMPRRSAGGCILLGEAPGASPGHHVVLPRPPLLINGQVIYAGRQ